MLKNIEQHGEDSLVKGSSKNKKLTYGALKQQIADRDVVKWELAPFTHVIAQINCWNEDTVAKGQHLSFFPFVRSRRWLTGGYMETWWRTRSIDTFSYPNSTASVDVTKWKEKVNQMAMLQAVPREFKKGEVVDVGGGKKVVRTKRGDLPAAESGSEYDDEADE